MAKEDLSERQLNDATRLAASGMKILPTRLAHEVWLVTRRDRQSPRYDSSELLPTDVAAYADAINLLIAEGSDMPTMLTRGLAAVIHDHFARNRGVPPLTMNEVCQLTSEEVPSIRGLGETTFRAMQIVYCGASTEAE